MGLAAAVIGQQHLAQAHDVIGISGGDGCGVGVVHLLDTVAAAVIAVGSLDLRRRTGDRDGVANHQIALVVMIMQPILSTRWNHERQVAVVVVEIAGGALVKVEGRF